MTFGNYAESFGSTSDDGVPIEVDMVIQPSQKKRRGRPPSSSKDKKHALTAAVFDAGEPVGNDDLGPMPEPETTSVPESEAEPTAADLAAEPEVEPVVVAEESPAEGAPARMSYDGEAAIKLYLREIGQVALLTLPEELALAARIKKGDKAAREHMIKANLRLVVKIARDYDGLGLPLLDLISEGNIGLMKAVERYDPSKGGKLSTYGAWWIKQSIKRALANQAKTIRLPVHLVDKIFRMRRVALKMHEELGREPTDDELADEMGISPARVAMMRAASIRPASLDAPIGDDDSSNEFAEVVEDPTALTPYKTLENKTVDSMVQLLIKDLEPREATILHYRYGLDGSSERTLEEVGVKFGITRERVRQIQNLALSKLRKMIDKLEAVQR